jgi:acyl-CoA synthetase (AMP-forming)/AMP-acid ligase II
MTHMRLTQALDRAATVNANGLATRIGDRQQTWSQFRDRVSRLASGLKEMGVKPGDRVAMLSQNSDRYLEWFFAVPWAGGVFVPINTRLAAPEVAYWLNDSGSELLFVDDDFVPMLEPLSGMLETVRQVIYAGDGSAPKGLAHYESLIDGKPGAEDAGRVGDDLAGLFYTGGTTGVSKGVMLSHVNLVANALNVIPIMAFDSRTNWLHAAPMFHLADGVGTFAVTMMAGGHSFVPKFDPVATLEAMQKYRTTHGVLVPTMVNMVVNHPNVGNYDLSSVERILYGASPMPAAVIRRALEVIPSVKFVHGYGQTESAPFLTALGPEYHDLNSPLSEKM